jgi:glycosidase
LFADEQPDLNWENPEVRAAVHDVVTFWLERGVRGFRLDVINLISKVQSFPDAEPVDGQPGPYYWGDKFFANGPRLHEFLQGLGDIFKKYDAFSVGETPFVKDIDEIIRTVGADRNELGMVFQFDIVQLDDGPHGRYSTGKFTPLKLKECITKWQTEIPSRGGWNALFIENHDQARSISRYLSDAPQHRANASKLIAMMLVFQSGTPFVYQGQELGLANVPKSWDFDMYIDIESQHAVSELKRTNASPEKFEELKVLLNTKSRDNARVPMQWDSSRNSGFSAGEPWMPLNEDYEEWNAAKQVKDPKSCYSFWSQALKLRKEFKDVVVYGGFEMLDYDHPDVITYTRTGRDGASLGVVLNFTDKQVKYDLPFSPKEVLLNNFEKLASNGSNVTLEPFQGFIALL